MINASIITIGDELLIGQVIDTNSAWMAGELNKAGVWLKRRVAVGDNREDIIRALNEESSQADIILITGGLGPTSDDITKYVLQEYFGGKMVMNEEALENIRQIFSRYNRPMLPANIQQATVPDTCTVIQNSRGTAPGMWFEKNQKIYVSLPGVPHEMKEMMTRYVIPRLPDHFKMPFILSRTLLTAGIGESFLADLIKDFEQALPSFIKLAYLPQLGMVRLRLTAIGEEKEVLEKVTDQLFAELKEKVKAYLVTGEDETLSQVIGNILKASGKTLATAESCTGGYIAHLITAIPGASAYFKGSIVSYANEIKEKLLNVHASTLNTQGAVSEQTVREMATGALDAMHTDFALAVSGIMGPDGGSPEKPVGTVWMAAASRNRTITSVHQLRYDRTRNIEMTANLALNLLRSLIVPDS